MTPIGLGLVLVIVAIVIGIVGLPWVSVPLIVIAIIVLIWGLVAAKRSDKIVTHRTRKPDLLGPGGPDDPDAS